MLWPLVTANYGVQRHAKTYLCNCENVIPPATIKYISLMSFSNKLHQNLGIVFQIIVAYGHNKLRYLKATNISLCDFKNVVASIHNTLWGPAFTKITFIKTNWVNLVSKMTKFLHFWWSFRSHELWLPVTTKCGNCEKTLCDFSNVVTKYHTDLWRPPAAILMTCPMWSLLLKLRPTLRYLVERVMCPFCLISHQGTWYHMG